MRQLSLILIFFITSFLSSAQETSVLVKKWKLSGVEEFGEKYNPTDAQINDFIQFHSDKKYSGLINGLVIEGTWIEKTGKYTLVPNKEKSVFKMNWIKMVSVDAQSLTINYQSTDLIQTKLSYTPAE